MDILRDLRERNIASLARVILISVIIYISFSLTSCNEAFDAIGITPTATPLTPTITPSATKRICPPASSYGTPSPAVSESLLILVLVDLVSNDQFIEFASSETTKDPVAFTYQSLKNILRPGDHYAFFRLGCREYNCARMVNEALPSIVAPPIPATPSPQSTNTPPSTPTYTGQTLFESTKIAREYSLTLTPHAATATEVAFQDNCAMLDWIEHFSIESTRWAPTEISAQATINSQLSADLALYEASQDELPTPYAPNAIFEGLRDISIVLGNECRDYNRCVILIFDDLLDWRIDIFNPPITPPSFAIDLSGAEVLTVMLSCSDIYQPNCRRVQVAWTDLFIEYGASNVIYRNGVELEQFITTYLRR